MQARPIYIFLDLFSKLHPNAFAPVLKLRDIFEKYGGGAIYENRALYDRFMKEYEKVKENPPVVEMLDGKVVRLPGYVVPLDMEADAVQEFLLVPDYGYCVHVPPPPANQLVHVFTRKDRPFKGQLFDVVWVTGKMRVVKSENEFGEAGYRISSSEKGTSHE